MQYYNPVNYCSDHNAEARAPYSMQYVVCPNEPACGDNGRKFITPEMSGEKLRRDIDKYNDQYRFVKDDVCSWIVTNPLGMGNKDWMWLKISYANRAEVFVNKGTKYVYEGRGSTDATKGKKFAMLKGKDFYVTGWSTSMLIGFFRLETWIEVFTPPQAQEEESQLLEILNPVEDDESEFEDQEEYTKSKKEIMKEFYQEQEQT